MAETMDMELTELWELASNRLRDRVKIANRLEELLIEKGITKKSMILDVSGGFGFPTIDLAKRGYQVVYNDGSHAMFQRACLRLWEADAPEYVIAPATMGIGGDMKWQDFDEKLNPKTWDALLCMGNSLPYAASWGKKNPNLDDSRKQIVTALRSFHRLLTPRGILYVDKQPESQDEDIEEVGVVEHQGRKVHLTSTFRNDKANRVRNWTLTTRDVETGEVNEYPSQGYLLLEDEFVPMLWKAGFEHIEKRVLDGEIYEGFVAGDVKW
jgi:SAM-dependent methyltransferase